MQRCDMQPRSETIKSKHESEIKSNVKSKINNEKQSERHYFELGICVVSALISGSFFTIQIISKVDINTFIQTFVQVNITFTLSIAALVASLGAFRWEHYIKGLTHGGLRDKYERRKYILKHAKKPLYRVIWINSVFIIVNLITLQSGSIVLKGTTLARYAGPLLVINYILIATCLIMGLILIYTSMRYMKELIFK
ncbi:hypothetical protein PMSM_27990 [Paenibacillus macquariensis subsp. macquariensis]|nr:hypothetical protein PMSM_27990 [Paenibacillus macquariensis subsp. macquariensis]